MDYTDLIRKEGKKKLNSSRDCCCFFFFFCWFLSVFLPLLVTASANMPQLNGGGGDDLGANDEMISFKDEGEQEEKISENVSAERDLDDVKSSLVNESESSSDSEVRNYKAKRLYRTKTNKQTAPRGAPSMQGERDLMRLKVSIVSLPPPSVYSPLLSAGREAPPNQTRHRKLRESEGLLQ